MPLHGLLEHYHLKPTACMGGFNAVIIQILNNPLMHGYCQILTCDVQQSMASYFAVFRA